MTEFNSTQIKTERVRTFRCCLLYFLAALSATMFPIFFYLFALTENENLAIWFCMGQIFSLIGIGVFLAFAIKQERIDNGEIPPDRP